MKNIGVSCKKEVKNAKGLNFGAVSDLIIDKDQAVAIPSTEYVSKRIIKVAHGQQNLEENNQVHFVCSSKLGQPNFESQK